MTVVALYRGSKHTHNAMVVDTVVTEADAGAPARWTEKLRVPFGNTYVTAIGEGDVVEALTLVLDFYEPKRPNLRSPPTIDAVLTVLERIRTVRKMEGQTPSRRGSVLFVCTRADAFYWELFYDDERDGYVRPEAPRMLVEREYVVFWGADRYSGPWGDRLDVEPAEALIDLLPTIDQQARREGKRGLAYPLQPPYSSVVIPHKPGASPVRRRPFNLPERIVRENWPHQNALLENDEFMRCTLPAID